MTVIVSKPAVNLREELASLRNQGGYQEQQFYFDSLVTNGTFDSNTSGWTAGNSATLSLSSNALKVEYNGVANPFAYQVITTVIGKTYVLSFSVAGLTSGEDLRVIAGEESTDITPSSSLITATGNYSLTFTAITTTTYVKLQALVTGATEFATFDSISVFEVDASDDVVHRMPKGWVPKDVFEDGLLQREGSAHDYEVVYDGFHYYVKPTVAPSATTQTCVIGVKA
jgi:hypothetical protein